jgi:tripartite-type tricarboxylate transporter receptor subunit TctC
MYVKEAEPDGYNLLGFTTSMISAGIINEMPVSYTDFEPVCAVANDPQYIYVKADSPWNTLQELIDDAIENPGEQKWGRGIPSGSNTLGQLLLLRSVPEAEITPVVFDGGSEVITAILGGHIDVGNGEYSELRGLIESGEIRLLAALTGERTSTLPDIPTAKELGYNAVLDRPRGLLAPKGTPDEIVQKIADIVETALENEEFVETLESEGTVVDFQRPEEFAETLDNIYNSYIDIDLYNLAHQE